jgi:hypothetical protein
MTISEGFAKARRDRISGYSQGLHLDPDHVLILKNYHFLWAEQQPSF